MFATIRHFVKLQDMEPEGVGQPGKIDASVVDTGDLWGSSGPMGLGAPGLMDPAGVPSGDLWGDTQDTLPY